MAQFISNLIINEELQIMYCTFNEFTCVYNHACNSLTMKGAIGGTRDEWLQLHRMFRELYMDYIVGQAA